MYNIDYMNDSINFSQIAIHSFRINLNAIHLALFRILIIEIQAPVVWQHIKKKIFTLSVIMSWLSQGKQLIWLFTFCMALINTILNIDCMDRDQFQFSCVFLIYIFHISIPLNNLKGSNVFCWSQLQNQHYVSFFSAGNYWGILERCWRVVKGDNLRIS